MISVPQVKVFTAIEPSNDQGKTPGKVIDYLLQGKFDPTNVDHVEYLMKVKINNEDNIR